jgi:PAS domain S-box-containing protein
VRALIVDDREESLYLLKSILLGYGYDVDTATNGFEALNKLNTNDFDLIISDVLMPVMDGFQLCRKIKSDDILRHIPFIIYTATYTGSKDEIFAKNIGANGFIIKPCEPDVFIEKIQSIIINAKNKIENDSATMYEEEILKLYNERLVRKLEQKMLQLEKEIMARQKVEKELRETNSFLDSIIENIPDMVFLKDADDLRFVMFNKAGEDLLDYPRNYLFGKNDYDLFPKDQADFFTEQDQNVLRTKKIIDIPEEEILTRSNEKRILHTKKVPIFDTEGNPEYLLGISEDITNLKKSEAERNKLTAQLLQAQKLESIGNLAGGIAHDFNNILAAIVGYSELAKDQAQTTGQSKTAELLDHVLQASERAKGLVNQILTFSRKTDQEVQPVNFGLIAKEALKLLRASLPPSIEMEFNIDADVGLVSADPTSIHQIIMNLCTNAAHAMKAEGGRLRVELHQIEKQMDELTNERLMNTGSYLQLVVADTGHGMTDATIERIFDPYFTTKEAGEGTGLGMSVVHGIVTSMGGAIDVKSELGLGTVFTILIPVANEQQEAPENKPAVSTWGSESILLVDDENSLTYVLSTQLRQMGYQVTTFNTGDRAWEVFSQNSDQFDAVITDLLMPGLPGDELAERIKGVNPNIPIIVYTGYGECLTNEGESPRKADALCFKPMHGTDIANVLRKLLDKASS